jgi:hypothetical protein
MYKYRPLDVSPVAMRKQTMGELEKPRPMDRARLYFPGRT